MNNPNLKIKPQKKNQDALKSTRLYARFDMALQISIQCKLKHGYVRLCVMATTLILYGAYHLSGLLTFDICESMEAGRQTKKRCLDMVPLAL